MPRRVNFCPFCGVSQRAGVARPGDVAAPVPVPPEPIATPLPEPELVAVTPPPEPTLVAAVPLPPLPTPPPAAPTPPTPAPPARAATPAAPPLRAPVKLRYWLLAFGVLWLIWITQRPPAPKKIEARIDGAIALASACKGTQAKAELTALKNSSATLGQLQRLEAALSKAEHACERKRTRAKSAPSSTPAPKAPASAQSESARNLIANARQALTLGNYKLAADKMEVCLAMVDAGNRECSALKTKANRLQGEMQRCLGDGREWIGERCQ